MRIETIEGRVVVVPDLSEKYQADKSDNDGPPLGDVQLSKVSDAGALSCWPRARHRNEMDVFVLRLVTDDGMEGICLSQDCHSYAMAHYVEDRVKGLRGRDPGCIDRIWHALSAVEKSDKVPVYVQAFVDLALWDLQAKRAGLPLYKLLGGYRDKVPAYASLLTLDSIDSYEKTVRECVQKGYRAVKIHVTGDYLTDMEIAKAVRRSAGTDVLLMFDASGAYDYEHALIVGKKLEELEYYWFEEPLRDFFRQSLARLRTKLSIPLNVGERQADSPYEMVGYLLEGCGDILHGGWPFKGGITALMKTANFCELLGAKFQIHTPGYPSLHLACALKNCEFYELIIPPELFNYCSKDLPLEPDRNGFVSPPHRPGIGWNIDWDYVVEHTVEIV